MSGLVVGAFTTAILPDSYRLPATFTFSCSRLDPLCTREQEGGICCLPMSLNAYNRCNFIFHPPSLGEPENPVPPDARAPIPIDAVISPAFCCVCWLEFAFHPFQPKHYVHLLLL